MTEHGPAWPRAQYQSCTTLHQADVAPVVAVVADPRRFVPLPSTEYVTVTAPCGTEGSQANSSDRSAPNSTYPVDGRHGGISPVSVTSTEISSAVVRIQKVCRSPVNRFSLIRTSAWSVAADHSPGG